MSTKSCCSTNDADNCIEKKVPNLYNILIFKHRKGVRQPMSRFYAFSKAPLS